MVGVAVGLHAAARAENSSWSRWLRNRSSAPSPNKSWSPPPPSSPAAAAAAADRDAGDATGGRPLEDSSMFATAVDCLAAVVSFIYLIPLDCSVDVGRRVGEARGEKRRNRNGQRAGFNRESCALNS